MKFALLMIALLLASCVTRLSGDLETGCKSENYQLDGAYEGARLGTCSVIAHNQFVLINYPEDDPPNHHSPWYGFRIFGSPGALKVRINYSERKHRYWPKISSDGINWQRLPENRFRFIDEGRAIELDLELVTPTLWVSAQENLDNGWYTSWMSEILEQVEGSTLTEIGKSLAGRPISMFQSNPGASDILFLVGRQHPAEVTGALALRPFVDQLLADWSSNCVNASKMCAFFAKTNIVLIPNLNPDGVALGHWRRGLGHMDLNRDWGPFSQPEIQAVSTVIDSLVDEGRRIRLFLDFHSTASNLFYAQTEDEPTVPKGFATQWLELAKSRGVYEFRHVPSSVTTQANSKNYMYTRFGIPALTYEEGDETDRSSIAASARIFASTMAEILQGVP